MSMLQAWAQKSTVFSGEYLFCFGADLITQSDSIHYFIFNGTIASISKKFWNSKHKLLVFDGSLQIGACKIEYFFFKS